MRSVNFLSKDFYVFVSKIKKFRLTRTVVDSIEENMLDYRREMILKVIGRPIIILFGDSKMPFYTDWDSS